MKLNKPWMLRLAGRTTALLAKCVLPTMDIKAVSCDPTTDPLHPKCARRYLYLTWHECVAFGLPLRANCGLLGIASEHRDGELLNQAAAALGWKMVRGSTTSGAVSGLKQLLREKERHINVAPDGPKGPRRALSQGAIYLASRSGLPIVCCAYGFDRPWRLNSWDRCAIPRPFSRARAVYGPPIEIPKRLGREQLETCRQAVEQLMNQLTCEAEDWAASGGKLPRQFAMRSRGMPRDVAAHPSRFQTPLSPEAAAILKAIEAGNAARLAAA